MAKKRPKRKTVEEVGVEVIQAMNDEFHESSDRIVAIVGAAYLDSMLETLFRAAFIDDPDDVDNLLQPDAPLGSNGSRIRLAYCMGLITQDMRDDLKLIARIRNKFAHDFTVKRFDTSPIRDYCSSLKQPGLMAGLAEKIFPPAVSEDAKQYVQNISSTPREKYKTSVISLFGALARRSYYVHRVASLDWFSTDPDAPENPS
ncbi:MltR family transcriptional regulator [Acidobacteriota bacterium]